MNKTLALAITLITCNAFGMNGRPTSPVSPAFEPKFSLRRSQDEKQELEARKREEEKKKRALKAALKEGVKRGSFNDSNSETD